MLNPTVLDPAMPTAERHPGADELIRALTDVQWGSASVSIYETGRVVSHAPWLVNHAARVRFLLDAQRADGAWGGPDAYALVPTLSAVEALLALLPRADQPFAAEARGAAAAGLAALRGQLRRVSATSHPDTVAAELIVPALVSDINAHLAEGGPEPGAAPLKVPASMDGERVAAVRAALRNGMPLPDTLWHSLEIGGTAARNADCTPQEAGDIAGSPAATAAWLGGTPADCHRPSIRYLETVAAMHDGPVPPAMPITVFERSWVLATLADAAIDVRVPAPLVAGLDAALTEEGARSVPGLPFDADATSVVLCALGRVGAARAPESLWRFQSGGHFATYPGESTPSTTVNAHVVEALGEHLARGPADAARVRAAVRSASRWLVDQQHEDGCWFDKWHASPYYATLACVLALTRHGGAECAPAVERAIEWTLAAQRANGSWGRWEGTAEETGYGIQTLVLGTAGAGPRARRDAVARGQAFLRGCSPTREHPPMWHDKDLYCPPTIVEATRVAALHLAAGVPAR
jgi:hypothetical protein